MRSEPSRAARTRRTMPISSPWRIAASASARDGVRTGRIALVHGHQLAHLGEARARVAGDQLHADRRAVDHAPRRGGDHGPVRDRSARGLVRLVAVHQPRADAALSEHQLDGGVVGAPRRAPAGGRPERRGQPGERLALQRVRARQAGGAGATARPCADRPRAAAPAVSIPTSFGRLARARARRSARAAVPVRRSTSQRPGARRFAPTDAERVDALEGESRGTRARASRAAAAAGAPGGAGGRSARARGSAGSGRRSSRGRRRRSRRTATSPVRSAQAYSACASASVASGSIRR